MKKAWSLLRTSFTDAVVLNLKYSLLFQRVRGVQDVDCGENPTSDNIYYGVKV